MCIGYKVGFFGGVYSNYLALQEVLADAKRRQLNGLYCLGDIGAFGPYPDRACEILRTENIPVLQGNYDHSIGNHLDDCQCGYTDSRDNYFAQLSYNYTFRHTSLTNRRWLAQLPPQMRFRIGPYRVLLCHGSPRKTNEFLWETATSNTFLEWLLRTYQTDIIVGTHTGLHWHRELRGDAHFVNCGAIGRPANDGRTNVVYSILSWTDAGPLKIEFVDLRYDCHQLAADMKSEGLPLEFIETIVTGWWTTCNEILPAKERARGKY
jgi:diadenosine tetraphosphatase ApaH/serine/threonine PP2A family protein phosphatase